MKLYENTTENNVRQLLVHLEWSESMIGSRRAAVPKHAGLHFHRKQVLGAQNETVNNVFKEKCNGYTYLFNLHKIMM